ncbi:hypothetical protein LUZ61_021467 [Rhynchospora tenuis]|uniref:DNA-directed RNA polymerase n=1 Tax=Rhynchospora tenuis TaxID=198213 RepID=A0AAD5YZU1_9POAL|nr:hypothetical protein LUZ61_021467 [Rhynchospora tenuis]
MFSHINLLSPAIGDPICVPTQDMLIGLYVLTIGNRRGICANSAKDEIRYIYIRTTLGHISFYREIEEAIQGFSRARI